MHPSFIELKVLKLRLHDKLNWNAVMVGGQKALLDNFMNNDQTTSIPCIQIHELLQHQYNSLVQIELDQYSYDQSGTH